MMKNNGHSNIAVLTYFKVLLPLRVHVPLVSSMHVFNITQQQFSLLVKWFQKKNYKKNGKKYKSIYERKHTQVHEDI